MVSKDKVAVVTGAGTGIGRAAALALLKDGWQVVLAGRRPEPLAEVALECVEVAPCLGVAGHEFGGAAQFGQGVVPLSQLAGQQAEGEVKFARLGRGGEAVPQLLAGFGVATAGQQEAGEGEAGGIAHRVLGDGAAEVQSGAGGVAGVGMEPGEVDLGGGHVAHGLLGGGELGQALAA